MPTPIIDITGHRFGRLVALARDDTIADDRVRWRCLCDCGAEATTRSDHLRKGLTRSCGCLNSEMASAKAVGLAARYGFLNRKPDDQIVYETAHGRIRRAKGKASDYPCVDCGGAALDWSLRHDAGARRMGTKNGFACPFSPDPEDYEPRCRSCHKRYDSTLPKQEGRLGVDDPCGDDSAG